MPWIWSVLGGGLGFWVADCRDDRSLSIGSEVRFAVPPCRNAMVVMTRLRVPTDRDRKWPHVGRLPLLSHCVSNFVRCLVRGCCSAKQCRRRGTSVSWAAISCFVCVALGVPSTSVAGARLV